MPAITMTANQTAGAHYQSSRKSRELLTLAFPSVTGASFGKQLQTITNPQYANANALMGNPNRPKLHRRKKGEERDGDNNVKGEGGTKIYETEKKGEDGG
ncbi:hypothetical protein BOTCAL_0159g00190 [Botryotinia calthae]|uniref:Uncharacterized protein n=1 Tax=Botryotinia calthae TaxID=38488 RepID=A0A4Y8D4I6_9HELO|nr:hypothetical protein BOTCAL_0159g00190 [Botryotinia calthae]